jgi:V8-like Glu-specific endopeptidase
MRLMPIWVFSFLFAALPAQETSLLPPADLLIPWLHDSGVHVNTAAFPAVVHNHVIHVPGAPALRVLFALADIGPFDWISVASPISGEVHHLNRDELAKWQNSSAYFNGSTLNLTLTLQPGSTGHVRIEQLIAGGLPENTDTLCGSDDRVASTDNRSMRFVSGPSATGGGCTIWLAGPQDCALSAGHCFSGGGLAVAEANVPPSLSSGTIQHPPVSSQFSVNTSTISYTNGGTGNDYGVCKLNTNNLGQSATTLFGSFTLSTTIPSAGETIRVTGCGTDTGVQNCTQQTSTGPAVTASGTALRYSVDTTGGNSGSPVIRESDGKAIGIHTHGGCTSTGGYNSGTSLSLAAFQSAYAAVCPGTPPPPPPPPPSTALDLNIVVQNYGATVSIANIPPSATHGLTLFSLNTSQPVGTGGTGIGILFDSLTVGCLFTAASAGNLFHWTWPVSAPTYPASAMVFPAGSLISLAGLTMDAQVLVPIGSGASYSDVVRFTF